MGISCTSGAGNRIQFTHALSTLPLSLSFWFRVPNTTAFIDLYSSSGAPQLSAAGTVGGDPINLAQDSDNISTSTGYSANVWQQCSYSMNTAGGTGIVYVNGGGKQSTTFSTGAAPSNMLFGSGSANVDIAEIAFWNVVLTDAEMAILGLGYSPLLVRPSSLVHYLPCVRSVQDVIRATTIVQDGSAVTDHPRIVNRKSRHTYFAAPPNEITASALSTLALSQSAALSELERTALNAIVFSYSTYPPFVEVGATNTLALVQERQYNNNAQNTIALAQQAYSPEVLRTIEQTLRLRHTLRAVTGNLASGRYRR